MVTVMALDKTDPSRRGLKAPKVCTRPAPGYHPRAARRPSPPVVGTAVAPSGYRRARHKMPVSIKVRSPTSSICSRVVPRRPSPQAVAGARWSIDAKRGGRLVVHSHCAWDRWALMSSDGRWTRPTARGGKTCLRGIIWDWLGVSRYYISHDRTLWVASTMNQPHLYSRAT